MVAAGVLVSPVFFLFVVWFLDARRGKPVSDQLRQAFPCEPAFLAAPPERSPPEIGHIMPERRERPAIGRDRVVGEVASHDLPQPFPLLWNRLMHSTQ